MVGTVHNKSTAVPVHDAVSKKYRRVGTWYLFKMYRGSRTRYLLKKYCGNGAVLGTVLFKKM